MKKTSSRTAQSAGFLFTMILFLMFILCSVFTILIGSRVYQNIRTRNNDSFYSGTALAYISNKVRQSDQAGCVDVRTIDDIPVLVLTSQYGDASYETWIYTRDGSLMELFAERDLGFSTADGLTVMECTPVDFSIQDCDGPSLLTVTLEADGRPVTARLSLRSSEKEADVS